MTELRTFVGRRSERAELAALLGRVEACGRGELAFLAGEPGIGKTRLLDELAAGAAGRGVRVVWGRCWETGGAPAYFPFAQALRGLWRSFDHDERGRVGAGEAAPAVQLLPDMRADAMPPFAPADDPGKARFELFEAVASVFRRAAEKGPILLALDDLHAADRSSLMLLAYLARELRTMALFIVGTFRDVEARLSPEVGAELGRISREGTMFSLPRLTRAESAELAGVLGHDLSESRAPRQAEALYQTTQGNPLFISEILRGRAGGGTDKPAATAAETAGSPVTELPHSVRELIRQRFGWLSGEARKALEVAAVIGDEFVAAHLAEILGTSTETIETTLTGARAAGIVVESGHPRLRFGHALFRESLYRDMPASRRQGLHGAVLNVLARRHEGLPGTAVAVLAHHALAAGSELISRAVTYAIQAADAALEVAAYEDAISVLDRARTAATELGGEGRLRGEATLALGLCRTRAGDAAGGREACAEAADLARQLGDAALLARAALGYGTEILVGVIDPTLVRLLEEALANLPPTDSELRVKLLARFAGALQPSSDPERPIAMAREALAGARRLGHEATLLGVMHAGMAAMMDYVEPEERAPLNREIDVLAARLGDRSKRLRANARLVIDSVELSDFAAAAAHVETYERLADETRLAYHRWRTPLMRSMLRLIEGRFAESAALTAEAGRLAAEAGTSEAARIVCSHRASSRFITTDVRGMEEDEQAFARAWSGLTGGADLATLLAAAGAAYREDVAATRAHLMRLSDASPLWSADPSLMAWLSEPVAVARDQRRAARILDRLTPVRDRCLSTGMSAHAWLGPVARFRGLALTALERWDEAGDCFQSACAELARLGARPFLARVQYEWARAMIARGRAADAGPAVALLDVVIDDASALGMEGLVAVARQRREQLVPKAASAGAAVERPAALAVAADSRPPCALSLRCEGEWWALEWGVAPAVRLKDSRGMRILAKLVAASGLDVHVLDLTALKGGGDASRREAVDGGDAGEWLDEPARRAYLIRIEELRQTIDEAQSLGDRGREDVSRAELEALTAELARALGLGGRARRAGSASERARVAVQRRLKDAIARVEAAAPPLGQHLARAVYTGVLCSYRPDEPRRLR